MEYESNLLANTSFDVASSLSSSDLLALLGGVELDGGGLANTDGIATSLLDAGLGGAGQSLSANFAGLDVLATVAAAFASLALFEGILDAVSAEG